MDGPQASPLMGIQLAEPGVRVGLLAPPVANILGNHTGVFPEEPPVVLDDLDALAPFGFSSAMSTLTVTVILRLSSTIPTAMFSPTSPRCSKAIATDQ